MDELKHYGVKGMHWGVRRYQNYDGTRIKRSTSDGVYKEAKNREPKITNDVTKAIVKNKCKVYGLENRLKTEESIYRKIANKEVNDAVRYTAILSEENFVKEYNGIKSDLAKEGYKEVRCKNYFEEYKKGTVNHKSVQSNYQTKDGYTFEIQFHTKSSQRVKDKKTPLYEESRDPKVSKSRKDEIIKEMNLLAEEIKDPDGIEKIKSYWRKFKMNELKHYGVKGMHWGVRRYQNYDGTRIGAERRLPKPGKPKTGKLTKKERRQEAATNYAVEKMKQKDYSKSSPNEIMNDWGKYKKEYKNNTNKESLGKKNGIDAYRKKVDYGKEPEGYSAKRQRHEAKLRSDIKKSDNLKEKIALKKELKNYSKESKEKAKEYHEWLGRVRDYTGNYKQYELVKNGDKFVNEWINKKTGQVITNKEYYDSFHYDATRRATDFIKLHYN